MKIKVGTWLEGREYRRAPDGSIWIDRHGVHRWIRLHRRWSRHAGEPRLGNQGSGWSRGPLEQLGPGSPELAPLTAEAKAAQMRH